MGCQCEPSEQDSEPLAEGAGGGEEREAPPLGSYFPLRPGDRWLLQAASPEAKQLSGISGVDDQGVAFLVGTGRPYAERYRASEEEIALVDPAGEVLVPILRAPLVLGASWRYELEGKDATTPCEASVAEIALSESIAGVRFEGCVEIQRICRYPIGELFAAPTTHTSAELYCPGVGRVREEGVFDPPPPGGLIPARRESRLLSYQVAGAPIPQHERFDCDALLLLPSDVQAACGPAMGARPPELGESRDSGCTFRYGSDEGALEIRVTRLEAPPEQGSARADTFVQEQARAPAQARDGVSSATGASVALATQIGAHEVQMLAETGVCGEENLRRLVPLIRSLLPGDP